MIDVRIYRAALLPVLLALVVVMFSFQERPRPLVSALAPDAFDSGGAWVTVRDLVRRFPDRRPGSADNAGLAELVEGRFETLGFETSRDRFVAEVDGEDVGMTNVMGMLSGPSDRQVVVVAHRDSARPPGASSATGTATLLELASALAGVRHEKTLVFVSTDGAGADSAGARRLAEKLDPDKVDAALVLDEVAAARARRPYLLPWSSDPRRGSLQLLRSASSALEREINAGPGSESSFGQFMRQAWPLTLREQGPLLDRGVNALTLTARGELPLLAGRDSLEDVSRVRLGNFGKAALATVLAVDLAGGPLEPSPRTYVVSERKVIPGWALSLLVFALLAPPLAASMDGFARARRRGRQVGHWARWVLSASVPFVVVVAAAYAFEAVGWLPETASEALAEPSRPSFAETAPPVGALALLLALAWLAARPLAMGRSRDLGVPGSEAGVALALVLSLELVLLWIVNPFAALLLVPAAHLALLAALAEGPPRPLLVGSLVLSVLLLPGLVLLYYGARLDLGLDVTRYALLLLTSGESLLGALTASLIGGTFVATVLIALARRPVAPHAEITVRGPRTYAGPGSLGGTESALRR